MSPEQLAKRFKVVPERNADFVTLALSGKESKEVLAAWANLCADEVVQYTKELQASEAGSISEFLALKLRAVERELERVNSEMATFAENAQDSSTSTRRSKRTPASWSSWKLRSETARLNADTFDLRIENFRKALPPNHSPAMTGSSPRWKSWTGCTRGLYRPAPGHRPPKSDH